MANQVDFGEIRYGIMDSIQTYMLGHTLFSTDHIPVVLGDPWLLDKFPCAGIVWRKDVDTSIYKGGKATCHIDVELWVHTESPDPEQPYRLLKALEGKATKVLTEYAYSNKASTDVGVNCVVDIIGVESDVMMFNPVYGLKLQITAKWNKLGR